MDDALLVRDFQGLGDLPGHGQRLFDGDRAFGEPIGKRLSLDILQDEVLVPVCLFQPVDRADSRVIQGRQHLGLTLEAGQPIRVLRQVRGHGLDRDVPIQPRVPGEEDLTHAAAAEFAFDFEWADGGGVHGAGSVSDLSRGTLFGI